MENQKNIWKVILGVFFFLVSAGFAFYGFLALISGAPLIDLGIFLFLVGFFSTIGLRFLLKGLGLNINVARKTEKYSLKKVGLFFLVFYLLIIVLRLLGLL